MKKTLLPLFSLILGLFSFAAMAQSQSGIPCPAGCDKEALCIQESEGFRFEYFGAVDQGDGTTQLKFKVFNSSPYPLVSIMFDLPGSNLPAVSPQASYIAYYHYSVQNNFNGEFIKYTGLNTATFRYDQSDVFRYIVDSATFHNGANTIIDVIAVAGNLTGAVTFNLEECDDMIIEPLPVELISFKGAAAAQGVNLTWTTASEKNNAYFSVQYSTDGRNFESAGYVQGKGTTSTATNYNFTHKDAAGGKMYYRLKQVDADLTSAYSQVIVVTAKERASLPLTVYPNPVTNQEVNVRFDNLQAEKVTITISDLNGRTVMQQTTNAARDLNLDLKGANLKPGIYLLNAQAGLQTAHQKIVIQ